MTSPGWLGEHSLFICQFLEFDIDLEDVASLFEVQLTERSGFLRSIKATEELLTEYELATTTNFVSIKEKKDLETLVINLVNEAS